MVALLAGLPWWGWVLLIVLGLVVGGWWAIRRAHAEPVEPVEPAEDPDAPPPSAAPGP